jgi:hypothetical protein
LLYCTDRRKSYTTFWPARLTRRSWKILKVIDKSIQLKFCYWSKENRPCDPSFVPRPSHWGCSEQQISECQVGSRWPNHKAIWLQPTPTQYPGYWQIPNEHKLLWVLRSAKALKVS